MSFLSSIIKRSTPFVSRLAANCINAATIRMKSGGKQECAYVIYPKCAPENLANTKCMKKKKAEKKIKKKDRLPVPDECCPEPCKDFLPRFDDLYYVPSEKDREYMQTWNEFRPFTIKRIPICCYDLPEYPPMEKRRRRKAGAGGKPAETGCAQARKKTTLNLMKCMVESKSKCPRLQMPGCRPGRVPPKCNKTKRPKNCKKICCPYPAFSECERGPPNKKRYVECHCLTVPSMCEVYAEMRKIEAKTKKSDC